MALSKEVEQGLVAGLFGPVATLVPAALACVERVQQEISYLGRIIESDSRDVHHQISQERDAAIVFQRKVHLLPVWAGVAPPLPPRPPHLLGCSESSFFAGLLLAILLLFTLPGPTHAFSRRDLPHRRGHVDRLDGNVSRTLEKVWKDPPIRIVAAC